MNSDPKSRLSADQAVGIVAAPTLKEALHRVRSRYGADARIIQSRTATRRRAGSLGQDKVVEILVQEADAPRQAAASLGAKTDDTASPTTVALPPDLRHDDLLTDDITREVERIERMVQQIAAQHDRLTGSSPYVEDYPLSAALRAAGVSGSVLGTLANRYLIEQGGSPDDEQAARAALVDALPGCDGDWESFGGCHVLLGASGAGKTDIALAAASKLHGLGKQTLVLSVLPEHDSDIQRLQHEASGQGYDAAIIQHEEQLGASVEHLARYDAVLIDTPSLRSPVMSEAGDLHGAIAQDAGFHRHLVVPLDLDFLDCGWLWQAGRQWNCDWTCIGRLDCCDRPGKILDLVNDMPLPVSLLWEGPWPKGSLEIAASEHLAARILESARTREAMAQTQDTELD